MAYRIINRDQILREALSGGGRKRVNRMRNPAVTLTGRNNKAQHFIISRAFNHALGEDTTHVAIEFDDETKTMVIRPSIYGEPAFKLHRSGGQPGGSASRVFSATVLRKALGIADGVKGRFRVKVSGNRLLVNLKPAFRKAASAA